MKAIPKRKKQKNRKLCLVLACIWVFLLVVTGFYFLFIAEKKSSFDADENRMLSEAPNFAPGNVWAGNLSEETENYLADHAPFRKSAISWSKSMKNLVSAASYKDTLAVMDKKDEALSSDQLDQEELDKMAQQIEQETQNTEQEPEPEESPAPAKRVKPAASPDDYADTLYLKLNVNDDCIYYYSYDKTNVLAMISVLNRFAACLPEDGELIYTMVPQSYVGNTYLEYENKQGFISEMEPMVDALAASNVQAVSTAEILGAAMERNEYVYFRTDMHWSVPGTYLVYKEMAALAGQTPAKWEDYDCIVEEPFLGTLYRDYPTPYMEENPDRLDLLQPKFGLEWRRIDGQDTWHAIDFLDFNAPMNDRYTVYLGGPAGPWTYAVCDNNIKRNCLVVCDSYGLAFVPMVTENYGQVHYYDPRYYDYETVGYTVKEMIEKYDISDIYVVIGDLHSYDNDFLLYQASSQLGD